MQRLRTVTLLDVSAVAGHHAMPAALLFAVWDSKMAAVTKNSAEHENDNNSITA